MKLALMTAAERARARKRKARVKRRRPVSQERRASLDRYALDPPMYAGRAAAKVARFYGRGTPKEDVAGRKR